MQPLIIRRAQLQDRSQLEVLFSEAIDPVSAQTDGHYVLEPYGTVDEVGMDSLQTDRVVLELAHLEKAGILYTLTVSGVWNRTLDKTILSGIGDAVTFSLPATDLSGAGAAPVPFVPDRDEILTFRGLPPGTTVAILSVAGERIWEERTESGGEIDWKGVNDHGQEAAAGVYVYAIVKDEEVKRGKLVLIR